MSRSPILMFTFSELASARERAGVKRAELARTAGIDRATLSRVEAGKPSRKETLFRLGNALNELYYEKKGHPLDLDRLVRPAEANETAVAPAPLRSVKS